MDVTTYITPPGFHLLDAAGTLVDGLAEFFSTCADAEDASSTRRTGGFLFSLAERGLMTARCIEEIVHTQHTATEALQLFNDAGDTQSAACCARLVVHALREHASASAPGHVGLEAYRNEHLLQLATDFLDEEVTRAELHRDHLAKAFLSLSRAEVLHDKGQLYLTDAQRVGEDRRSLGLVGSVLREGLVLPGMGVCKEGICLAKPVSSGPRPSSIPTPRAFRGLPETSQGPPRAGLFSPFNVFGFLHFGVLGPSGSWGQGFGVVGCLET